MDTTSYRSKARVASKDLSPLEAPDREIRAEILPLEMGDQLSQAEFERRYEAMPGLKKAELIEGRVFVPSPVRLIRHGQPHFELIAWLGHYKWSTPGLIGADNTTMRLDLGNEPQPDICLFIDPARGGQARVSDDDFLEKAPELVAEIASSSVSYDLHAKLEVYRRNGVCEFLVWRVLDRAIDWFVLKRKKYVKLPLDENGFYRSSAFPGLWLDPSALIRGDTTAIRAALQRGLASPEHAAFVARLNAKAKP